MEYHQPYWITLATVFGLGAIVGNIISFLLTSFLQRRTWINDNKKAEWRELFDKLDTSLGRMEIAFSKSFRERDTHPVDYMGPLSIGSGVMNDRIFIASVLLERGITTGWREITAYVCSADSPRDDKQVGGLPTLNGYRTKVIAFQKEVIRAAREDLGIERPWYKFW
jgi:hypothetical protein